MTGECADCRFFERINLPEFERGQCRRLAPTPDRERLAPDGTPVAYLAVWPTVVPDDWCGEFVKETQR